MSTPLEPAVASDGCKSKNWTAIYLLALGQTVVWAGLYYVFAALALRWEQDLGWDKPTIAGAFTLAIVISAVAAPGAGAIVDRGYGRLLLTGAALLGAAAIGALPFVDDVLGFYALWALIGAAMAGCLYEPCFAYVTRACGDHARAAITRITLVAGFAGTVSFPTANLIAEIGQDGDATGGWRVSAWAFAVLIAAIAAPSFWIAGARLDGAAAPRLEGVARRFERRRRDAEAVRRALRAPIFWLIALAFSTMAMNHGALINHLLAILDDRGVEPALAVLAASMIGPMQVLGRVAMMTLGAGASSLTLTAISFATVGLAAVALLVAGADPLFIALFAIGQGAGYGLTSILRPVVAAELLGRDGFGSISGLLAAPYLAASAAAPLIGALLWSWGGSDAAIVFAIVAAGLGLAAFAIAAVVASTATVAGLNGQETST